MVVCIEGGLDQGEVGWYREWLEKMRRLKRGRRRTWRGWSDGLGKSRKRKGNEYV